MTDYAKTLFEALKPADPKEQCANLRRIMDEENRKHAETFMRLPVSQNGSVMFVEFMGGKNE